MFRFRTKPESVWIAGDDPIFDRSELGEFPKDQRKSVHFKIRPLTDEVQKDIAERNTKTTKEAVWYGQARKIEKREVVDDLQVTVDTLDYIVEDWEGVADEDESIMTCNINNKLKLVRGGYPLLGGCWVDAARWAMSKYEQFKAGTEKNLKTSQNGQKEENDQ